MLLQVINVETFYGRIQALFGVSLDIRDGEIVTLLGRNGMGKSTTVKSIIGMNRPAAARSASAASASMACRRTASPAWASDWCPRDGASSPT
jgi:branched-chain amino acid transport system ATP-binding protein